MNILVLLWAWSSVLSWIPTFQWIWSKKIDHNLFDHIFLKKHQSNSIKFYKTLIDNFNNKKYNEYHIFLKELNKRFNLEVISQNIDNLDKFLPQTIKLHWNLNNNRCIISKKHKINKELNIGDRCNICNSYIFPDILYYWEKYDKKLLSQVKSLLNKKYDFFIVIWTTLNIWVIENIVKKVESEFKININPDKIAHINNFYNFNNLTEFKNKLWCVLK